MEPSTIALPGLAKTKKFVSRKDKRIDLVLGAFVFQCPIHFDRSCADTICLAIIALNSLRVLSAGNRLSIVGANLLFLGVSRYNPGDHQTGRRRSPPALRLSSQVKQPTPFVRQE